MMVFLETAKKTVTAILTKTIKHKEIHLDCFKRSRLEANPEMINHMKKEQLIASGIFQPKEQNLIHLPTIFQEGYNP